MKEKSMLSMGFIICSITLALLVLVVSSCIGHKSPGGGGSNPSVKEYPDGEDFSILSDRVIQGPDKACVALADGSLENSYEGTVRRWVPNPAFDSGALPRLEASEMPLLQALWRLASEEAVLDIRDDKTFMAGAKWPGVWTRDISYSIHLSLALLFPEISKNSLMAKTDRTGQIIQDTGSGGSWPVSTDRVVWALAAWEIYLATGEPAWLESAYTLLAASAEKDRATVYDGASGLYRGESSFTDWREQTYPKWMKPVDIYESQALSTNVLHYKALKILADMARVLNKPASVSKGWDAMGDSLARSIGSGFTVPSRSYLGAYRYSPETGAAVTDKSDTLANSLALLFDAVSGDSGKTVLADLPVVHFGPPIIYPQMQHAVPYHNKAVWPFVTAYYGWAGLKEGNGAAFDFALRSNVRAAALFLTNKENFVYNTGHWRGTDVNSDRQLWSVAGFLSQVIRGLFGVAYDDSGMGFAPVKPEWVKGTIALENLKWRNSVVTVRVSGTGSVVKSLTVNGEEKPPEWRLAPSDTGTYTVAVELTGTLGGKVNLQAAGVVGPRDIAALEGVYEGDSVRLSWTAVGTDITYRVYRDGKVIATGLAEAGYSDTGAKGSHAYQVQTVNPEGVPANLSQAVWVCREEDRIRAEAEDGEWKGTYGTETRYGGYQGRGFITLEKTSSGGVTVQTAKAGKYLLRWRYSNGNGPINTENKAAVRSLSVNGKDSGTVVFAQTAKWADWTWSNSLIVDLPAGEVKLGLSFNAEDENMNLVTNQASVDSLELIRL